MTAGASPSPDIVPDSTAPASNPIVVAPRLWPGVVAWTVICATYVILERLGVVEGLDLPVPLIAALVFGRVVDHRPALRRWSRHGALPLAVAGIAVGLLAWRLRARFVLLDASSLAAIATAAVSLTVFAIPALRRAVMTRLGLDPASAVHVITALAVVATLASSAVLFAELQSGPDETIYFHPFDSVVSLASDAALALAGIGFLLTRGVRAAMERLDLRPIRVRQVLLALALAGGFLVIVGVMERAESAWLPALHAREDRFDYEFVGMSPWLGAVLLSVAAGMGEELVFRGALQPRLGVLLTAVVFAAVHVQYQLPGLLMIFVVGLGLGLAKRRTSTTFTVCVHVFYDMGAFLLPDL